MCRLQTKTEITTLNVAEFSEGAYGTSPPLWKRNWAGTAGQLPRERVTRATKRRQRHKEKKIDE